MSEVKAISDEVNELAKILAKKVKIDGSEVVFDADAYVSTLPEGLGEDTIKALQTHNSVFFPAAALAAGHKANKAFAGKDAPEKIKGSVALVGKDTFDLSFTKKREYPNPQDKDGPAVTKYCVVTAGVTQYAARNSVGEFAKVCNTLSEEAIKAYGG